MKVPPMPANICVDFPNNERVYLTFVHDPALGAVQANMGD